MPGPINFDYLISIPSGGTPEDAPAAVVAPASTTEEVQENNTPTAHRFNAFSDIDGRIVSYQAEIVHYLGDGVTITGSGLGPYTFSNFENGDVYTLRLKAMDVDSQVLASGLHTVTILETNVDPVEPPAATSEVVSTGDIPSAKTFGAFTGSGVGDIFSYEAEVINTVGSTTHSGSGLGPYTFNGYNEGNHYALTLKAKDSGGTVLATAIHVVTIEPPIVEPVQPPAPTFEAVASGATPTDKTFGAFTDESSLISSYSATLTDVNSGGGSLTGSGLGPYAFSGTGSAQTYVVTLAALDASGDTLATAVHTVTIAAADANPVQPPASTFEAVAADGTPSGKTFSAFTDTDGLIASYSASIANVNGGSAVLSGSGLGPYTVTGFANDETYVITLDALNGSGDTLSSVTHTITIANIIHPVQPPANTFEAVAENGTPAAKTFGAFTDNSSLISSYSASLIDVNSGGATLSGTGLGPYTLSGAANGQTYIITLNALDADTDTLASASHTISIAATVIDPVQPPASSFESVVAGGTPAAKTFGAFTDPDTQINSYSASIANVDGGTATLSGSGLGPYTVSGFADGESYVITLDALDSGLSTLASVTHTIVIEDAVIATVQPPASSFQAVAEDGTPNAKTFSAFTDPDGVIDNYLAELIDVNATGATLSGTGLGPYTVSGTSNGNSYVILLKARNASNEVVATATHAIAIAADSFTPVTPPNETTESLASGVSPSAKTFGAFTDPAGLINSYSVSINNVIGSTTISGSGLGPYTFSGFSDGDSFVVTLDALDSSAQVLATAVHAVAIQVVVDPEQVFDGIDWIDVNLTDGSWTLDDNFGLISSVSYNSTTKIHTFTLNEVTAGTWTTGLMTNNSTPVYPIWYKSIQVATTTVSNDDSCIYTSYMSDLANPSTDNLQLTNGICEDATQTTAGNIRMIGNLVRLNTAGNQYGGCFQGTTVTIYGAQNNLEKFFGHTVFAPLRPISVSGSSVNNLGNTANRGTDEYASTNNFASGNDLQEFFSLSFQNNNSTMTQDETVEVRIRKRVFRFDQSV